MAQQVTFWFDCSCPFAWLTSRWIKEVEKVRDIEVTFEPMSLSVLNQGRDLDPEYMKMMEANWGPARVAAKIAVEAPDKVDAFYTAMGTRIHTEGQGGKKGYGAYDSIIEQALDDASLPADFASVANTEEMDEKLTEFHNRGISEVGDEAFFGPVITRVPTGEEAGELFDASVRLAQFPYFFELKRSRTEAPRV